MEGIHTGELESVHSLHTVYVPKRKKYIHEGMKARLHLAALDHNYIVEREQAQTKEGEARYKLQFSKPSMHYVVKPIKVAKEHHYREELIKMVLESCRQSKCTNNNVLNNDRHLA